MTAELKVKMWASQAVDWMVLMLVALKADSKAAKQAESWAGLMDCRWVAQWVANWGDWLVGKKGWMWVAQ